MNRRQEIEYGEYPRLISEYKSGRTARDLAEEYGVSISTIKKIVSVRSSGNLKKSARGDNIQARPK